MAIDNPAPRTTDTLTTAAQAARSVKIGETRARLENFLRVAYKHGPGVEDEYERTVADLRKEPEGTVIEIAKMMGASAANDFPLRWALIFAACELRHRAALALLTNIVDTPLPEEPKPPAHGFSIVANETILRTTAIDGIGELAKAGNKEAYEALFRVVRTPSISMRRAAVQAILQAGRSGAVANKLKSLLPPEQHFLLTLKRPSVDEVPQVKKPQQYLSEEARQRSSLKPPEVPGGSPKTQEKRQAKSPKSRGDL